ncbi:type II secretion system protein [Vibrio sp. 10N.247.311.46]|uniref:type II secretion system protein n=2 Tax=Vibrio TaxID=662 RepID=UPI003552B90C
MMNSAFKQRGVGIVEFLITLGLSLVIVGISYPAYHNYQEDEKAKAYGEHIRVLIERIHQYQYYKITEEGVDATSQASWPATLDNLMNDYPEQYWGSCTIDRELNGECKLPDYVPWSHSRLSTYFYTDLTHIPAFNEHLVIRIPLHELDKDAKEWTRWSNVLIDIPGAERAGNDIDITLRQATLALMYENIVMRDGFTTLTGDWDVGGAHGITNAKDVTLRASDGSQIPVSQYLVSVSRAQHGDWIDKPQCIAGQTPQYKLSISKVEIDTRYYTLLGGTKPYLINETATRWQVGMSTIVKINSSKQQTKVTTGEALLIANCR